MKEDQEFNDSLSCSVRPCLSRKKNSDFDFNSFFP